MYTDKFTDKKVLVCKLIYFLQRIKHSGVDREDRTGVGTRSILVDMRFNLAHSFPLLTKKDSFQERCLRTALVLQGNTNTHYLTENGVRIWNEWAMYELGPVYGKQWRSWHAKW